MGTTLLYCDRVLFPVEENVDQIDRAIRYTQDGVHRDIDELGETVWQMTDGPWGFIRVTIRGERPFSQRLRVDRIGSYRPEKTQD